MTKTWLASRLCALLICGCLLGCGGAETPAPGTGGAGTGAGTGAAATGPVDEEGNPLDLAHLSAEDQKLALAQKICPVGGDLLGSGGMKTVKVNVDGRDVFLCCEGCEGSLREDPATYFAKLDGTAPEGAEEPSEVPSEEPPSEEPKEKTGA